MRRGMRRLVLLDADDDDDLPAAEAASSIDRAGGLLSSLSSRPDRHLIADGQHPTPRWKQTAPVQRRSQVFESVGWSPSRIEEVLNTEH